MEPDFVMTEAEKDGLKRKREQTHEPSPPPPSQQDHEDTICDECGNFILAQDEGECAFCIDAMLTRMKHEQQSGCEEEDEPGEDEQSPESGLPDLHDYFNQFPAISDENVISMCRAYASYLASLSKKKIFKKPDGCLTLKRRRTRLTK